MARSTPAIDDLDDLDEPDDGRLPEIIYLSPEESSAQFDRAVRKFMGISGDEFIRRWDAGEYDEIADTAGHLHIMRLGMLIPFGR